MLKIIELSQDKNRIILKCLNSNKINKFKGSYQIMNN